MQKTTEDYYGKYHKWRKRGRPMRFRFIDIEATAEELKANKTIVDVVREAML